MPLFGNKKENRIDLPEVVDFSNDTWSYKGNPPEYQIQSDGFTYDITDVDGNDKNAISLGISGMLVIVLNAKSPKIKEDEILPPFGKVIKTRNWHTMTVKEANFLVQTAIKKLTNSATSGDVFDLASYAPLEVKRVLLKELFTISRMKLPPEFREEAEHRIIDDIVPDIFANPDYELALLTGLIVKPDEKSQERNSAKLETNPVIEDDLPYSQTSLDDEVSPLENMPISSSEPDSAFAELQKIYSRKVDSPQVKAAVQASAAVNAAVENEKPQTSDTPQINIQQNPIPSAEPVSVNPPNFSVPQPNNPFTAADQRNVPQPTAPNFGGPQPYNPFAANQGMTPQGIPQPPVPNYNQQGNYPYGRYPNQAMPQQGYPQENPYSGNFQQYPPQPRPMNASMQANANPQTQFPPQGYPQYMQGNPNMQPYPQNMQGNPNMPQGFPQNMQGNPNMQQPYQQNPAGQNPGQNPEGNNFPQQQYPGMQNRNPNLPQQNSQNN